MVKKKPGRKVNKVEFTLKRFTVLRGFAVVANNDEKRNSTLLLQVKSLNSKISKIIISKSLTELFELEINS